MARSKTTLILNLDAPDSWQRLRDALAEAGCDEAAAAFVWEQVKSIELGQLDPRTRSKPRRNYLDFQRALNAETGPAPRFPDDDIAVVWERAGPSAPRNVRIEIYRALE
jgi:hypothetical protein